MRKINKAWVTTNVRADGKKYYTAFIRLIGRIFWIIPVYYTCPIVRVMYKVKGVDTQYYEMGFEGADACSFGDKFEAEHILLQIIDNYLDNIQEEADKRIVKRVDTPVSFGSFDH